MGFQPLEEVTLIRHAYVLPDFQRQGLGSKLLEHLKTLATTPRLLVGTWADAIWAIEFYEKHGFRLLANKEELLRTYWDIPERQIETSVVLGMTLGGGSDTAILNMAILTKNLQVFRRKIKPKGSKTSKNQCET